MKASPFIPTNCLRVVLLRKDATEVLLETDRATLAFPLFEIPTNARTADECNKVAADRWGFETYCLETRTVGTEMEPVSYMVMESYRPGVAAAQNTHWVSIRSLEPDSFIDPHDVALASEWLGEVANRARHERHHVRKHAGVRIMLRQDVIQVCPLVVVEVPGIRIPAIKVPGQLQHIVSAAALGSIRTELQLGGEPAR